MANTPTLPLVPFIHNDLIDGKTLLTLLGTFWSNLYGGKEFIEDFLFARASLELQTARNMQELVNTVSRYTCPVYHQQNWQPLTLSKSLIQTGQVVSFGAGYLVGPQTNGQLINFGVPIGFQTVHPNQDPTLVSAALIVDQPNNSTVALTNGMDFILDTVNENFVFLQNPFNNSNLQQILIYDSSGNVIDQQIELFMFTAMYDKQIIYNQIGYYINILLGSSQNYLNLLNAVLDAVVGGTTMEQLAQLFAAITDTPIVLNTSETVQVIDTDSHGLLIVTDQNVYRFPSSASPIVSTGQVVYEGNQLVDTVAILELNNGQIPVSLTSVTLDMNTLLGGTYKGTLTFNTTPVSTIVTLNVSGKTKIEWPLVTTVSSDNTLFWNVCHARGVASGITLANLLDSRTNPVDEPTAANLPVTINPLGFLITNVLRYNSIVVQVKVAQMGPNNLGLSNMTPIYRKIMPPEKLLIVQQL